LYYIDVLFLFELMNIVYFVKKKRYRMDFRSV
jgi:hypothetical protein